MRRIHKAALAWLTCFLMIGCGGGAVGPTSNQDGDLDGVNADSDLHADLDNEDTSQEQTEESPDSDAPSDGDESPPDGEADLDTPLDGDLDEADPTDGDTDLPTENDDIAGCTSGAAQCTPDGYGFETCGLDTDAGVNSYGPRIPCAPNQECQDGVCNRSGCLETEVLFLLDRSASMNQSGAWAWIKPAFTAALNERDHVNYFGFRQFPQGECTAGAVVPLAKNNAATIAAAITDPTVASATPIADALQGLALDFGDPNDGQAVVLITDGEETCGTQADAVQAASALFRAGVRVYVVAVTTTANRTFLNQLAQVGGTGTSRLVRDGEEFAAVLDSVMGEVGARRCAPDNVCCETDGCALTDPSVVCASYADTCNAAACNEAAGVCFADPEPKEGVGCNDGALCTHDDQCQGGVCQGQPVTCSNDAGTCGARRACNGTAQCTVTYPDTLTACDSDDLACTDDHCSGQGACLHDRQSDKCLIGGVCFDHHQNNPANPCEWCNAAQNAWAAKDTCDDGNPCTYNDRCNGQGVCVGTSIICSDDAGVCGAKRTCNGTDQCTVAYAGTSTTCESDGLTCTQDRCNGQGSCLHTPLTGKCSINGACYNDHQVNPANSCQWCDSAANAWADKPSTESCNDGNLCTYGDHCNGQGTCTGSAITCTSDTGVCGTKRTCNGTDHCTTTYPSSETSCNDGTLCTYGDHCDGSGGCVGTSYSCGAHGACNGINCTCEEGYLGPWFCTSCAPGYFVFPSGSNICIDDPCTPDPCNGHGTCDRSSGQAECTCSNGFTDTWCNQCSISAMGEYPYCSSMRLSAGGSHTCALLSDGALKCWGHNQNGQLGDGTFYDSPQPVSVWWPSQRPSDAGGNHTCGLSSSGGVKCWGANHYGQLGDGTTTDRRNPVDVTGLIGDVVGVSAGFLHSCAVLSSGDVKCWGDNSTGQLGDGTTTNRTDPVIVDGLAGSAVAVSAGQDHTCALLSTGGVECWGANGDGQLGDGTTIECLSFPFPCSPKPKAVIGLSSGVVAVSAGYGYSCALLVSGSVKCWGNNNGTPIAVGGLSSGVIAVSVGGGHACAILSNGGVKCWGNNGFGQLGDGTTTNRSSPVQVGNLTSGVVSVTAGEYHTCALMDSDNVKCWGWNDYGQLGDGTGTDRYTPVDVVW